MKWWMFAVLPALFAGCVSADESPAPDAASDLSFHSVCNGVFYARLVPFPELTAWLPPGYEGADAARIFEAAGYAGVETNRGFMAVFGNDCEFHRELHFGILVEEPNIDAPSDPDAIHWYEVATFFENFTLMEALVAADFAVDYVNVSLLDVDIDPAFRGKVFEANDTESGALVLDLTTFGSVMEFNINSPFYTWQSSPIGTHLLMADVVMVASLGDGNCHSEYDWVIDFVGECERGQPDTMYGRVDQLSLSGEYSSYPGIFAR